MTTALTIVEIVPAVLLLALVLAIFSVYLRRRLISHDSDVVTCAFRPERGGRWRPSLLRMTGDSLQVYPLFGWTPRPAFTWRRRTLDLGAVTTLEDTPALANAFDAQGRGRKVSATGVTDTGARMEFDLALGPLPYTALRYWVESSPPTATWGSL